MYQSEKEAVKAVLDCIREIEMAGCTVTIFDVESDAAPPEWVDPDDDVFLFSAIIVVPRNSPDLKIKAIADLARVASNGARFEFQFSGESIQVSVNSEFSIKKVKAPEPMNFFVAMHTHRHGTSVFPFKSRKTHWGEEQTDELVAELDIDFEPEREETIEVFYVNNFDNLPEV